MFNPWMIIHLAGLRVAGCEQVLSPEAMTAINAARANQLQRTVRRAPDPLKCKEFCLSVVTKRP